jgi:perosamine synthetase
VHYGLGWNYRLTNIQAALGIAQLKQLDKFVKIKRKIGNKYKSQLRNINHVLQPLKKLKYCENIYWVYGLVIKKESKLKLDEIRKQLFKKGIETRNFFWPLNKQPILKKMGYFKNQKFPVAEFLGKNGFYIPTGLALTEKQQNYVIRNIKNVLKNE